MKHILALLGALTLPALASQGTQALVPDPETHRALASALGAAAYTIEDLAIPVDPVRPFTVEVNLGGQSVHLDLAPSSIRGPGFTVHVSDGRGGLVAVEPPPARTVRGFVRETGDEVGGALLDQGLRVTVLTDWGFRSIGPLSEVIPAPRERHFVIHWADEVGPAGTCPGGVAPAGPFAPAAPRVGGGERGLVSVIELRAEADFELFVRNGSDLANTIADVESVMQSVNIVYERDVAATHQLLSVLVRTVDEDDPYLGVTDSGDLLGAFRNWWNTNQAGQHRDLAHLFTGKELDGSIIGLAYIGVVCDIPSFAYGLSETRFSTTLSRRTGLTAHEIGHNFSASHCNDQSPCHIMCSTINGCNGLGAPNFGPASIATITGHIASADCLDDGEGQPLALPVVDTFPIAGFDARTWSTIDGAVVTSDVIGEPSSPYAALLTGSSNLVTDLINKSGPFDRPLTVEFWAQANSLESGENLEISYTPEGASRTVFASIPPPPAGVSTVGPVRLVVPGGAVGSLTAIGFHSTGNSGGDEWFIDDVRIDEAPPLGASLFDPFDGLVIDQWDWPSAAGAVINAGSPNPTSPPFVMNLDNADRMDSRAIPPGFVSPLDDMWVFMDVQSNNVEPGKSLRLSYMTAGGQWTPVWDHSPRSTARSSFRMVAVPLPEDAEHEGLAIRLQVFGADGGDDWFIDDLLVQRTSSHRLPIADDFDDPEEVIDPTNWFPIDGAVINGGATDEPSGTASLNLDNQDSIVSRGVDLSGVGAENRLVLRFWLQHNGVDPGRSMLVDYRRSNGAWANAWAYASPSADRVTVGHLSVLVPPDALHADAAVRIRATGNDGTDDWFIDNLRLELGDAPSLPVRDEFVATVLDPLIWADDDDVAINSGALDEPSPPYAMNLDRNESAIMQPINATSPNLGVVARFWLQHNGVEPDKNFFVEYTDAGGTWRRPEFFTSGSTDRTTYGFVHVPFDADAAHPALQVRLRVNGTDGSDDWFIDDLEILGFTGVETPFVDSFLTARLDPVVWTPVGTPPAINQGALDPPSPPLVLNLDWNEVLETGPINAAPIAQRPTLRFWMQHNGVEPGESLTIEWRNQTSDWEVLEAFVSGSASRSPGQFVQFDLPQAVSQSNLRLRFSVSGDEANDDWFLDDVALLNKNALTLPFAEDFESVASMGNRNWSVLDGIVTQSAIDEPSGAYSLRLGEGGRGVLLPIDLADHEGPLYARFWGQYSGPAGGFRTVVMQYEDASGADRVLGVFRSTDAVPGEFVMFEAPLPPDAFHDAFALELATNIAGGGVFFFIDDVQIDGEPLNGACPADLSGDGVLDFFDLQLFLNAFAARDPAADFNEDGLWDFFDVQTYLNLFGAGCP